MSSPPEPTATGTDYAGVLRRSEQVARNDAARARVPFPTGTRPVIRWIKCDGLDDPVTRAAIAQATRLFGSEVDYCLCTHGISASRARSVLEWADQPVEWMPVSAAENEALADLLVSAGCDEERFGYWWKWFPERVRPDAPEWILDGDMVITQRPSWFGDWAEGRDPLRMSQDDRSASEGTNIYGAYRDAVDTDLALYSGLVSLPPGLRYMPAVKAVLDAQPLARPHDGIDDMSEQGVIAAAFQRLRPLPIPLFEFPFGRAFEDDLDFGLAADTGMAWGYHFGHAFRRSNHHFDRLTDDGVVFTKAVREVRRIAWPRARRRAEREQAYDANVWLGGGVGQWGVPGWGMPDPCVHVVLIEAQRYRGREVLDLGTSRGRLAAMLCEVGCRVTTVDHMDRGAARNLEGLPVTVVVDDAVSFMETTDERFDLVCVDLHGNTPEDWQRYAPALERCLAPRGALLVSNVELWKIPEWTDETGAWEFIEGLGPDWKVRPLPSGPPGMTIATRR